jgi:hypothetical protein
MTKKQEKIWNDIVDALVADEMDEHGGPRQYLEFRGIDVDTLIKHGMEIVKGAL